MDARSDIVEAQLQSYIEDATREYKEVEEKYKEIRERLADLADTVESLRGALEFHLARAGKEDRVMTSEFAAITSVREAVHLALQKYGEMDKQQLRDILQKGGFKFEGKRPIPAIHFALVGDPRITITENSKYQWVENGRQVDILSLPRGIVKFFVERNNESASKAEVLEGIERLGVRTTTRDLHGNVEFELNYGGNIERTTEGKYRLKKDVFEEMKGF